HLMQRRLYMDEECLLAYEVGGMEFEDIYEFDEWMARPSNRDRLLPFPRCMIAMRVRRNEKARKAGSIAQAFINIRLAELDKLTFLYIRNGEQLFRMNCDLEFDELLFPEKKEFDLTEEQMILVDWGKVKEIKPKRELDDEVREYKAAKRAERKWYRDNPLKKWRAEWIEARLVDKSLTPDQWDDDTAIYRTDDPGTITLTHKPKVIKLGNVDLKSKWKRANPHYDYYSYREDPSDGWGPFNPSTVYYDDATEQITNKIKHYNRIALIIQGLYDRSPVLHPHPPVKTWTPGGFLQAIELVYDGSGILYDGEAPDFDAYRDKLRESLGGNSVVIGQQRVWMD
ncbi:hypothetical protein LCGC14_3126560, partial [marine sediment metagenome]